MSGALREWRMCWTIARQGLVQRRKMGRNPAAWLLLVLAAIFCAVRVVPKPGMAPLSVSLASGTIFVLALLYWGYVHRNIVHQNGTSAGRLVPGLRRRSLKVIFTTFALLALGFAALFTVQFGLSPIPLALIVIALSMVAGPALHPGFSVLLVVLGIGVPVLGMLAEKLGAVAAIPLLLQAVVLVLAPLILAGWVWAELRFLGVPVRQPESVQETVRRWYWTLSAHQTMATLVRYLPTAAPPAMLAAPNAAGRLLLHGVGYDRITLAVVCAMQLSLWFTSARDMNPLVLLYVSAVFQALLAFALRQRLEARVREQGLIRLAPRTPGVSRFNGVLGHAILVEYLVIWLGTTAIALGATYLITRDPTYVAGMSMLFVLTLPAAGLFLRDYARRNSGLVQKAALAAWLAVFAALPYWSRQQAMAWQVGCIALALAAACAMIALAMKSMQRAPIAFPAGRLA